MLNKILLFIGLLLTISGNVGFAQTFDIKKISTNEGLPAGQISDVIQDSSGYMWFSTYEGLVRFDGYETRTYNVENGFRNNLLYDLFIDSKDRLWVSVEDSGVGIFDGDSVKYLPELTSLDSLTVIHISESNDGRLWFSTYGQGVFIWDDESLTQLAEKDGLPSNYSWNILHKKNGEAWIGTWNGMAVFEDNSLKETTPDIGLNGISVYNFADGDGKIWASTSNGVTVYEEGRWRQIEAIDGNELGYVYFVLVDNSGKVWIGTEGEGIYWYDGNEFTHINKGNGLSSNYIYSLYEDNEGRVWVATDENGVNIFRSEGFRVFEDSDFVMGESVNVIFENDEGLWLGTDLGITKFSENGVYEHFRLPEHLVNYKEVWDIDQLPNGNLLVQNSYSKLLEFDGKKFSDYGASLNISNFAIQDIKVDEDNLWMATETGLRHYKNGELQNTFTTDEGLVDDFVWHMYQDLSGQVWAVTDQGFSKILGDSLRSYTMDDGIRGTGMHFLTQSPDSMFWVGTNKGFSKIIFDEEENIETIFNYTLPKEFLRETQFLEFDDEGNIWQGTSGGLHYHKRDELPEEESNTINGLFFPLEDYGKGLEMNYLSSHKDESGDLWFGSYTHGLIEYDAKYKPKVKPAPKPILRSFQVNGVEKDPQKEQQLELEHSQNNLTLTLGALFYESPQRVFYRYKLQGFDEGWRTNYGTSQINFTNLEPGEYQLEVQVKSIQSDWGEVATLASIQVKKPFWETAWFYGLIALLIVGILYFGIRMVMISYQKNKLGKMVDERTKELQLALDEKEVLIKEIHHRVKNNMAVVSGLLELQGYKIKDEEAKSALENSKLRIQTMSSIHEKLYQNETLTDIDFKGFAEDLIQRISASMKGADQEIHLHLDIRSGSLNVNTAIPCGLILNELISNCYEHAFAGMKEGNIWVNFRPYIDNKYRLEVNDDGVGISEDVIIKKRSSLGVTLIHSLTSQIKGDVEILNDEGTKVIITLPSVE